MGSVAHVVVDGPPRLLDVAADQVRDLERRWSRFIPDSELMLLNAAAGVPTVVSPETLLLVARCVQAWDLTGGAFDPTVHDAVVAAGYDRTFAALLPSPHPAAGAPVPGVAGIDMDAETRTVCLPPGTRLDAGGLGKGLAADIVVDGLLRRGATSACVNLGGDLRAAGPAPDGPVWRIDVQHPLTEQVVAQIGFEQGAVATSSPLRRAWLRGDAAVHHLIDPSTGRSATTTIASATVLAGEGWYAEAFAKAAVLSGSVPAALARLAAADVAGLIIDLQGRVFATPDLKGRLT
jgi:thiamine biosynthesis lipoprotein